MKLAALAFSAALFMGCSSDKNDGSNPNGAPDGSVPESDGSVSVIHSEDEVCSLLTPAEVGAQLGETVTARVLPKAGEYSAPECGWLVGDDESKGVSLVLFFHPEDSDGPGYFEDKVTDSAICPEAARKPISGLGDKAVWCGRLWVLKNNDFFSIGAHRGDASTNWPQVSEQLARQAVTRLP